MRKLWLTFTAMLLCSIASFAQTAISTKEQFLAIQANGNYILTADINLGDFGEREASIISSFSGTFNGDGHTITYQASFKKNTTGNWWESSDHSLFGSVSGTIKNLNVNANVTLSGTANNMNVALICGTLKESGVIEYCNASGNVNSTVNPTVGGGSDAGLIVGQSAGIVRYCTGSGNVVGAGYVGGLIGQMKRENTRSESPRIMACSFVGAVTAVSPTQVDLEDGYGSFAGGICGHADNLSIISFCVADGTITSGWVSSGIVSVNPSNGTATVTYTSADGEIIVTEIGNTVSSNTTNSTQQNNTGNYYGQNPSAQGIVDALEAARISAGHNEFYFDVVNGHVVLIIGQRPTEEPDQPETPNYTYYRTIKPLGGFNEPTTWEASVDGNEPWVENVAPDKERSAYITINEGHKVTVSHDLVIRNDYKITANNGVLQITQQGQLINNATDANTNVPGIVEIVSPQKSMNSWTFIGAPFGNTYELGTIYPMSHDISVSKYNYGTTPGWSNSWATVETVMSAGEGYFAWPFYDGAVTFTTYGDVWNYEEGKVGNYVFNGQTATNLNNTDVTFTRAITTATNGGYWMALSNPYPAKLKVSKFLEENGSKLQGNCVYVFKDGSFDQGNITTGDIAMTEGFFVNFANNAGDKTITFNKGQLSYNNPNSAKASANEFIKLTLINGNKKVRAYLAHNENAEQGYDIFDANKLFAPTEIAEPYFVTDGVALMKEEFAELPYYATMNVRSFANDTVSFVVNNIPEGLAVSIIDGENVIDMVEGGVYTTEILTGENADRFKVLIKKNLGIADVEELEVNITNNNRHISIETTETDLQVEVYNALGQKVLSTKDRNFTLNQVSAGAYLIKAFNNKASKTQKIVVE